ncbi:4629_t:CDS:2, partial [Dentiscutata heterogama]
IIFKISNNEREKTIIGTPPDYANLFIKCWSSEPYQRPTLNEILLELERLSKEKDSEFITNIIDDKKINEELNFQDVNIKNDDEFRQPTNKTDGPDETKKMLWNNELVNLCLLENYRCDNSIVDDSIVTKLLNELKPFKHNNVLEVFGLTFDGYSYYFVRGYYTMDLRSYLSQLRSNGTPLSWIDKLTLTQQVVEGLKYLHDQNIIHQELHPKNIVIYEGIPKLINVWLSQKTTDFSISKFSPPEILLSNDIENKTTKQNIYSLGVQMWEISSDGIEPFHQKNSFKLVIDIIKGLHIRPTCKKILDKFKNISLSDLYHGENGQNTATFWMPKPKSKIDDLEFSPDSMKSQAYFVNYCGRISPSSYPS